MAQKIYQVDAFTSQPFGGNPAGVCVLPGPGDETWMRNVAREMNLAETAFLYPQQDGYNLRWFTPAAEVDLCGHATLATAHILWEIGALAPDQQARFHTRSGLLTANLRGEWIELNFPATLEEPVLAPPGLAEALGVRPVYVGKNIFDYLVEVESEAEVRALKPDFNRLGTLPARGVIVTSRSADPAYDFVSRFFAPAVGINEDPVTGSAHCCLAPYWSRRLANPGQAARTELNAYQASARGGVLRLCLQGERVLIAGQAVTVLSANLFA